MPNITITPSYVPVGCNYLTEGKHYVASVQKSRINGKPLKGIYEITDDQGDFICTNLKSSYHLDMQDWIVVEGMEAGGKIMKDNNVENLPCFEEVASVLGKQEAKKQLFIAMKYL